MRRVVGSTLAAETQSLLNGLGHAEWIAAHFAEARFSDFDVAQRSAVLQTLSSPMHCVLSGHFTAMHAASWSHR